MQATTPARKLSAGRRARGATGARRGGDVATLISDTARRLDRARLCYGHGTDNAFDEAAALVFHAAGYAHDEAPAAYRWPVTAARRRRLEALVRRRIDERIPAAYLTGRVWFAGHEIRVDPRVLVPRSPLAEFLLARGAPFLTRSPVRDVLDLGTGSGCIAIAAAHAFRGARVDATDVSAGALAVARANVRRHGLERRVHLQRADVFQGLAPRRYDMILANPPYVPDAVVARLPAEYRHEPRAGLASGRDGLDVVRRILAGAAARLRPRGLLVVEVGDSEGTVAATWPDVPFLWLEFSAGGGGVFLLDREALIAHAPALAATEHPSTARKRRVR